MAALEEALAHFAADPRAESYLLSPPEIYGWNSVKDRAVGVRLTVKVSAANRASVARVLRQYTFAALQDAGVPIESSTH